MNKIYKPEITEIKHKRKRKSKRRANTNLCKTGGGKDTIPSSCIRGTGDNNYCLNGDGEFSKNMCSSGSNDS